MQTSETFADATDDDVEIIEEEGVVEVTDFPPSSV